MILRCLTYTSLTYNKQVYSWFYAGLYFDYGPCFNNVFKNIVFENIVLDSYIFINDEKKHELANYPLKNISMMFLYEIKEQYSDFYEFMQNNIGKNYYYFYIYFKEKQYLKSYTKKLIEYKIKSKLCNS